MSSDEEITVSDEHRLEQLKVLICYHRTRIIAHEREMREIEKRLAAHE